MGADEPTPEPEDDEMNFDTGYGSNRDNTTNPYSRNSGNLNGNEMTFSSPKKPTGAPRDYKKPSDRLSRIEEDIKSQRKTGESELN